MGAPATVILFPEDPSIPAFFFDMTKKEQHTFESEVTESPVENGGVINDHVIHKPDTFVCTVVVSNTPLEPTWEGQGAVGPIVLRLPGYPSRVTSNGVAPPITSRTVQAVGFQIDALEKNRVVAALDWLNDRRLKAQPMLIATPIHIYEHMILSIIDLPVDRTTQRGEFTLTFKHLEIVSTDQVTSPAPKEARGAPQASAGKTGEVTDPIDEAVNKGAEKLQQYLSFKKSVANDLAKGAGV